MTDSHPHSPVDTALDLLIYAPVGLAVTAAEELPKLAAKGRASLGQRLTIARMVGQFAVTQGRKEIERRLAPPAPKAKPGPAPAPAAGSSTAAGASSAAVTHEPAGAPIDPVDTVGAAPDGVGTPVDPVAGLDDPVGGPVDPPAGSEPPPDGDSAAHRPDVSPNGAPGVGTLAIPGYDSLAASQVVQRLAGLSRDELDAVGAYESSHRNRRTILTRVRQLQAG